MPSYRTARAAEDIKRELCDIMRGLKDPRITGMLSIVALELSSDYSYCTIHISSLDGLEAATNAVEGLQNAAGFIRRALAPRLSLRKIPELKFIPDNGMARSAEMDELLRRL